MFLLAYLSYCNGSYGTMEISSGARSVVSMCSFHSIICLNSTVSAIVLAQSHTHTPGLIKHLRRTVVNCFHSCSGGFQEWQNHFIHNSYWKWVVMSTYAPKLAPNTRVFLPTENFPPIIENLGPNITVTTACHCSLFSVKSIATPPIPFQ